MKHLANTIKDSYAIVRNNTRPSHKFKESGDFNRAALHVSRAIDVLDTLSKHFVRISGTNAGPQIMELKDMTEEEIEAIQKFMKMENIAKTEMLDDAKLEFKKSTLTPIVSKSEALQLFKEASQSTQEYIKFNE